MGSDSVNTSAGENACLSDNERVVNNEGVAQENVDFEIFCNNFFAPIEDDVCVVVNEEENSQLSFKAKISTSTWTLP